MFIPDYNKFTGKYDCMKIEKWFVLIRKDLSFVNLSYNRNIAIVRPPPPSAHKKTIVVEILHFLSKEKI